MPFYKTVILNDGILSLWELPDSNQEFLEEFPQLNDDRFRMIISQRRQKEWLATRTLLLYSGCQPNQLSYLPTGKPIIAHPEYKFISISHSAQLAGILLTRTVPTGLDIESKNRNFSRVEKKYLSEEERLLAVTQPEGHAVFWCIKEAVYKLLDHQGIIFDSQIKISTGGYHNYNILSTTPYLSHYGYVQMKINDQIIVFLTLKQHESKIQPES